MLFDSVYYIFENDGGLGVRFKGNPIVEHGGIFGHGSFFADDFIFKSANHFRIEDFHQNEGDQLVFNTGYGLITSNQLVGYVTDMHFTDNDFVVSFGDAASITLVGVHPGEISLDAVVVLS